VFGLDFRQCSSLSQRRVAYFYLHSPLVICIVQQHEQLLGLTLGLWVAAFKIAEVNVGLIVGEDIDLSAPSQSRVLLPKVEQGAQFSKDLLFVVAPAVRGKGVMLVSGEAAWEIAAVIRIA
jgi:hypothetical protein